MTASGSSCFPRPSHTIPRAHEPAHRLPGTKHDPARSMRQITSVIALGWLWTSAACAQTSDGGSPTAASTVDLARGVGASLPPDPIAARADSLVRAGRPWPATVLLASALRTPSGASPAVRLVGARAAAAWRGWSEVERILRDAPWLDAELEGEGREL